MLSETPFLSKSSNLRKYLNFSFNSSSLVNSGFSCALSKFIGTLLNLPNPSHVLFSFIFAVDLPKFIESVSLFVVTGLTFEPLFLLSPNKPPKMDFLFAPVD